MDIQAAFKAFGYSALETKVYVALLEGGASNGSALAKQLCLTRASVYGTLRSLVDKGAIHEIPGTPQRFEAMPHQQLLETLRRHTDACMSAMEAGLAQIPRRACAEQVLNYQEEDQFFDSLKNAFGSSTREIYLAVCSPLSRLSDDISACVKRGVRVIGFTFNEDYCLPGCEWYVRSLDLPRDDGVQRIIAVFDMNYCMIGGRDVRGIFLGIATRNSLLVKIVAEHIHHDIYLARMHRKTGVDPVQSDIVIHTMHEPDVRRS